MFTKLHFKDWRQFSDIDIDFHEHLTILTGANGSGKTTILNLLSKSIGWEPEFVSSYEKDETGIIRYCNSFIDKSKQILNNVMSTFIHNSPEPIINKLGELVFSDRAVADLILPDKVLNGTYSISIKNIGKVTESGIKVIKRTENNKIERGVYINSHRPNFPYRALKSIPTTVANRTQIYQQYYEFNKTFIFDRYRDHEILSATALIKKTLASLATFGYGNQAVNSNNDARKLFEGYVDILKIVLPPKLGFQKILVTVPEVMLCTETGNFPLDAVSGGISSIIDITWQLYMFADTSESFIALIDEPENHLHPELQKNFLGNLIKAFPHVQFVIATHNPFMITSQKDSYVYVLNYDDQHRVYSRKLDDVNKAGTSNAILRDVLGIDSTMPLWATEQLEKIVEKYSSSSFSNETLKNFREELSEIGLADYIPESIAQLAERTETHDND